MVYLKNGKTERGRQATETTCVIYSSITELGQWRKTCSVTYTRPASKFQINLNFTLELLFFCSSDLTVTTFLTDHMARVPFFITGNAEKWPFLTLVSKLIWNKLALSGIGGQLFTIPCVLNILRDKYLTYIPLRNMASFTCFITRCSITDEYCRQVQSYLSRQNKCKLKFGGSSVKAQLVAAVLVRQSHVSSHSQQLSIIGPLHPHTCHQWRHVKRNYSRFLTHQSTSLFAMFPSCFCKRQ